MVKKKENHFATQLKTVKLLQIGTTIFFPRLVGLKKSINHFMSST
jgi:hypothetical protein